MTLMSTILIGPTRRSHMQAGQFSSNIACRIGMRISRLLQAREKTVVSLELKLDMIKKLSHLGAPS